MALHIVVLLCIQLSPVQSWLGNKVASALSETLGTDASVGHISIGLFNRLIIDDVCIPDLQGDTLLRASRLSVKGSLLPLLEGRIVISSAQLFGAHVRLCQEDSTTAPNYQFVIDALSSDDDSDDKSPLDLHIGSLIVRHSSVSYDRGDAFTTPGRFNPAHLAVNDISTHISLKALNPDSLNINLKRLSLREQSGFTLENFSTHLIAGPSSAHLHDLNILLPHSTLTIDTLDATYDLSLSTPPRISEYTKRHFMNTLRYNATLYGTITPADLAPLIGGLKQGTANNLRQSIHTLPPIVLSTSLSGSTRALTVSELDVLTPNGGLTLKASGSIETVKKNRDSQFMQWHVNLEQLDASAAILATLEEIFPDIPDELSRLGNLHFTAKGQHLANGQTDGQATIVTSLGTANILVALDSHDRLSGYIDTDSLHLGQLLANDDLGSIAATVTLGGTREQMEANANIHHFHFKGYHYHDIEAGGSYQPETKAIAAHINIDNADLKVSAAGGLSPLTPQSPIHQALLSAHVGHINPSALGLTNQWGDAAFSAIVNADITASSLADAKGNLRVHDFTMYNPADSLLCHIDHLQITSETDDKNQTVTLTSDVAVGELSGQFNLATLPRSLARYMASKLPTLPGLQHDIAELTHTGTKAVPTNDFNLHLTVSDTRWMQPLLGVPLTFDQPLHLIATVDDNDNTVNMSGRLPAFTYSGSRYRDLHLSVTTLGDSALCNATLKKLSNGGGLLSLAADVNAANNNIFSSLTWRTTVPEGGDTLRTTKGIINAVTQLYTNADGRPVADIGIQPSQVMVGDKAWHIRPSHLAYSDGHLDVDSFAISHGGQHLFIDGMASASHTDTLSVDMDGIDIAYIQDLLDFHPVDFSGLLGGKAKGTAVFGDFAAWADIVARDFRFMDGRMGTLKAQARWNAADTQIDIDAVAEGTIIQGYISPVRSDIDLKIRADGSNIEFCHSFTESFLRDISGTAHGDLELAGPLGDMNLTGMLIANGQMTIDALNTTYQLRNDTVHFVPNDIQFHNAVLTDRDGNTATLSGGIHHQWLSDFTFDLDVETRNVLVYDFPSFGDSNICGNVHATGHADLHGRPGEVTINIDVTPQAGSTFAYNAANRNTVSKQEFITWETEPQQTLSQPLPIGRRAYTSEADNNYSPPYREGQGGGSAGSSDLIINFLINATPDATLRLLMDANTGDYITLNGEGTIRASYHDKGPFHMFGTYTVSRGTYGITIQNIIKKNFTFQPEGTIIFGGDPYEATLNLQAVHTVNGVSLSDLNIGSNFASNTVRVNCLMNIQGTPSQPRVDFDLEMPTVNSEENQMIRSLIASEQEMNQQVLYLLGIGRFYTQGANNADAQQYGQTTLAMQSFLSGTVSTQINEVLSQVIKSNDWNFGANISTGDEGWNNAEYEGIVSGRLLNNRLLINGQFGYRDNATTATPSFIGDFDLQYLLKRNGNLAVKVYNQTNDRYFTRSSLNTQGVGLVMKKDFDGLDELLRKKNKKKKVKEKTE